MLRVRAGAEHPRMVYRPETSDELESGDEENGRHGGALRPWLLQQVQPLSLVVLVIVKIFNSIMLTR